MYNRKHKTKSFKKIVAFIGDKSLCEDGVEILKDNGFHRFNIGDKVQELATLSKFKKEDITNDVLSKIRYKGYQINRTYWINLLLTSIPEDKTKIVIPDLMLEDVVENVMQIFYITKDKLNFDCPKNIEIIYASSKEELKKYLAKVVK
jgi:hypothetical protein